MRFTAALLGALAILPATSLAQPSKTGIIPLLVPTEGTLGLSYALNGEDQGLVGFNVGIDSRLRRHTLGARLSFAERFGVTTTRRAVVSGVYTFSVEEGLSFGTGVSYVAERYRTEGDRVRVQQARFGVPLELTIRPRGLQTFGPFVRVLANVNAGRSFGGLTVGTTF